MQVTASLWATFTGKNGSGAITLTGALSGDVVAKIVRLNSPNAEMAGSFETSISVSGEIQQSDTQDLSGLTFGVLLLRAITTT
jgi:hypothetical protein